MWLCEQLSYIRKSITLMFMSSSRDEFTLCQQNSVTDVSARFRSPCWCSNTKLSNLITNCDSRSSPCDPSNKRPALVATQPSPQAFSARSFLDSTRLRAVSLFHWSVEQNVRDMQTTTRVTIGCRPRFSPLVASPLDARARVHFPHKI